MKVCTCVLLFRIFAFTNSSPLNTPQEDKKGTDLALEVFLKLHLKDNSKNVFVATNKTDIDNYKVNQPMFRAPTVETFTDFIQGVANILNNYEDTAFEDFFDILDEEIRKYHYRGCKFYELTENYEFRSLMAQKLDLIKRKPVPVLKADTNEVVYMIRHGTYDKNVKEMLDYINSLYREDAREKFRKVLSDLKAYTHSTSERTKNDLVKIIRDGIRTIVFNHYTDLNINVRRELKREIERFLKKIKEVPSSSSKTNLFPYNPALKESENTGKISRYKIATADKNTAINSKKYPTSTADDNNMLILKASGEKHGEEATKLKTSKEDSHSVQMQLFPYKPALRESENTVKIFGYNIATADKNTGNNSKKDPTSTADDNNMLILKASGAKNGEEATKLKTSKEDSHNEQMQLMYVSTDESSADETNEGNSIELLQEHQEFQQSYTTLFMEEIICKTTETPESMFMSELKSKLVQRMLAESTGRLPTVQPTTTFELRQETTSETDTETDSVILIKAIRSRDVSDEDFRRSIAPPLPGEELSIEVFDREERKRQKSLEKHNRITTAQHEIKDYIKRMRKLQNEINQLKRINEYNQNSRMNVTSNVDKVKKKQKTKTRSNKNKKANDMNHRNKNKRKKSKKFKKTKHVSETQRDEYDARTQTEISNNTDRKTKRDVERTNSVNKDVQNLESNKEKLKRHNKHVNKFDKQNKVTRSKSKKQKKVHKTFMGTTDAATSVNIRVRRYLKPLPTAENACNTTDNDNNKRPTQPTSTIAIHVGNATLNVTEEVKPKRFNNTATDDYVTKDIPTRRYRRVLEFSSPPLFGQPFFEDHTFRKGIL